MRPLKNVVWNRLVNGAVDLRTLTNRELISLARKGISLAERILDLDQRNR